MQHRHPTPDELAARSGQRLPMARALRRTLLTVSALLWLSGVLWLLLHYFMPLHNEFGTLPNPAEAPLMRVHGLIAVLAVFLCGWLGAGHIAARWSAAANRRSGLWLLGCAAVLVVTGYALYYSTGALHSGAALLHEVLGVLAIVAALSHWLGIRARATRRVGASNTLPGALGSSRASRGTR
jgi:succinate dehydrogenase hydrophobic anchor subunit